MGSLSALHSVRRNKPDAIRGVQFVPLPRLPEGLQFPEPLHERIWFDEERKCLAFRGFMSKATYDRLDALANDLAYQRALDELFQHCVDDEPISQPRPLRWLLPIAALVTAVLLAVTLALPLRFLAER